MGYKQTTFSAAFNKKIFAREFANRANIWGIRLFLLPVHGQNTFFTFVSFSVASISSSTFKVIILQAKATVNVLISDDFFAAFRAERAIP